MNVSREAIFQALTARLAAAKLPDQTPAFVTCSRHFVAWDQCPPAEQPACYVTKGNEQPSENTYGETSWRLRALVYLYCQHSPDSETIPGTNLNYLLDAADAALRPDPSGRQTLDGLVSHCYIDGEILATEGNLPDDTTSVAVIPVTVETGV